MSTCLAGTLAESPAAQHTPESRHHLSLPALHPALYPEVCPDLQRNHEPIALLMPAVLSGLRPGTPVPRPLMHLNKDQLSVAAGFM